VSTGLCEPPTIRGLREQTTPALRAGKRIG